MASLITFPIKMIGLAAAGAALAVGWKIGSYIVNTVASHSEAQRFFESMKACCQAEEPLWKRQYSKISDE
jgi:hypothetical protein